MLMFTYAASEHNKPKHAAT